MYIYRQKFDIRELVEPEREPKRVMIVDGDSSASALYAYHLSAADYIVKICPTVDAAHAQLPVFAPHALIVNPAVGPDDLRRIRLGRPSLPMVSAALGLSPARVSELMDLGVSAHLDRGLTRPSDIVAIINSLIN